jgi:putative DNA primase/helicase
MKSDFDRLRDEALLVRFEDEFARRGINWLKQEGDELVGPCPLCAGTDRFATNIQKQVFNCRGCKVGGNIIHFVRFMDNASDWQAVATLTDRDLPRSTLALAPISKPKNTDATSKYAVGIWREARPATGTLVEVYLRSRSIIIPTPLSLRFVPQLKHKTVTKPIVTSFRPAMIAIVTCGTNNAPVAVHRTYLSPTGGKAVVDPVKKMLGPVRGGCVRLAAAVDGHIMVGEGIETCLAAMQLAAMQGNAWSAWSALSAGGMKSLNLSDDIRQITVLADNDANGAGEAAARDAARRWQREGRIAKIARPPAGVKDFADWLEAIQEEAVS